MSLNQTRAQKIRGALLSIAQNESVFLFVAFVSYSFLSTDVLAWYADSIAAFNRFVVLPWGGALCLLCDLIARTAFAPTEVSISSVTAVFGAPIVIYMMIHRKAG